VEAHARVDHVINMSPLLAERERLCLITACQRTRSSDRALALFSFPSLAAYKEYRTLFGVGPDFIASDKIRVESQCVLRYERSFMRPILDAAPGA